MGVTSGLAVELAEQIGAHFRDALAAVLHQEGQQPAHPLIIGAIVDEPAFPLGLHESRPFKNTRSEEHTSELQSLMRSSYGPTLSLTDALPIWRCYRCTGRARCRSCRGRSCRTWE